MEKKEQLYEGKAKKVYATEDPEQLIVSYKDDATAFNGQKKGTIAGKGAINNRMSNFLMAMLEKHGVPTHLVQELNERETVVKKVSIVPLEVIIRNISAGSFSKRYGVAEGIVFEEPTLEFSYKNDDLGDPLINRYHALALKLASREELETIQTLAFRVNEVLKAYFLGLGMTLWTLSWSSAACPMAPSSWPTRSPPIPAAFGTAKPMRSWTRTASAGIWAAWKRPIRRSCAA